MLLIIWDQVNFKMKIFITTYKLKYYKIDNKQQKQVIML